MRKDNRIRELTTTGKRLIDTEEYANLAAIAQKIVGYNVFWVAS